MTARRQCRVLQADIARTLRAVKSEGVAAEIIIEPDGRIRIVPAQPGAPARDSLDDGGEIRL